MQWITPNWPWTLNNNKYSAGTKDLPLRWNFGPFCSTTTSFRDMRSPETRKCTEWPETELGHLTVKSTLYTLITYHWGSNFLFRCALRLALSEKLQRYNMYKVGENRKYIEWPQTERDHITLKRTLYTLNTPEDQISVRFALRLATSEIHVQGRRK